MINEDDAFPFVFREHNDKSAYIDYQEIANREKKNSKVDIDNNQALPLLDTAEKLKSIKVGSRVVINSCDSIIGKPKELHIRISTVIECRKFCNNKKQYKLDCDSPIWFNESDLILMEDSIPVSGQSANTESYVYDEKIYNIINKACNEMAGMINQKSNIDNLFKKSFENVQSLARASIEENSLLKFDIDKYNKNYTEMAIKAFKDNKDRLTDKEKPINETKTISMETFTIICNKCGSKNIEKESSIGFSSQSGSWGSLDIICVDCGNIESIFENR